MKSLVKFLTFIIISIGILVSCSSKDSKIVLKKADMATFMIYTYDEDKDLSGIASGFFIDNNGTGITNFHVLDGCSYAIIYLKDGNRYEIDKVLTSEENWDIAKFTIKHDKDEHFTFLRFSEKRPEQGDKTYLLGSPHGLEQTLTEGIVAAVRTDSHGQIIQITAPALGGNSGSPIMNEDGDVVAVLSFGMRNSDNYNFGVLIDDYKLSSLTSNDFDINNSQFYNKQTESNKQENIISYLGSGKIGKFSITLSLSIDDNDNIKGNYFYHKKESKTNLDDNLSIIGKKNDDVIILYELDENEDTTGIFEGETYENIFTGKFTVISNGKTYPFKVIMYNITK